MATTTGREQRSTLRFEPTRAQLARRRRSLLLPILLLVAISLLAVGGILFWSAGSLNQREALSQQALVESLVEIRRATLRQLVIDYAWWDEAGVSSGNILDERWAKDNLAEYLYSEFGVAAGWVVSPDNEVKLAFTQGETLGAQQGAPLPMGAQDLIDAARQATSIADVPLADFAIYEQDVALMAASLVAPLTGISERNADQLNVMVFLRPLDLKFLESAGLGGHIEDLQFVRGPAPEGYNSCPIIGANGRPFGHIVWHDSRPGSEMLWNAAPFLLVSLLAVGFLLVLAIKRVETAVSSEGRLSVSLYQEKQRRSQKSRFVSMVSHELRTPLQAIGISSDALEQFGDRMTRQERREEAHTIHQAVGTLARLVDDVLVLGRGEVTREDNDSTAPLDLGKFCQVMWREVSIALRSKQELELDDRICAPLETANELALHAILSNLMQNAIKYSRGEGAIKVKLELEDGEYTIAVTDFGPGIPEAQTETIFEPYWRAQDVESIAGTGLGLAVARTAAQSMGGDLRLVKAGGTGDLDRGTCFLASWPAAG
ncbi:MAG: ATP-binding protein [Kiloniellaceae bacterium]